MATEMVTMETKVWAVLQRVASCGPQAQPMVSDVTGLGMCCSDYVHTVKRLVHEGKLHWPLGTDVDQYPDSAFFATLLYQSLCKKQ